MPSMRLWQRKKGQCWYVDFYRGKSISLKTTDETRAKIIFKKLEREYLTGRLIRLEKGELKLLGDFIKEYLDTRKGKAKNTYRADKLALSKFLDFYGNKPMFGITKNVMARFRSYLESSALKPRSRNNYIKHLRLAINSAMDWEYVKGNPLKKLKQFKVDESKYDFLKKDDINRLLNAAAKYPEMRTAIAIQVYTGMSRAEVISAMGFEQDSITYKRIKTGKHISVPIAQALRPFISHLQGIQRVVTWKNPRTYSKHFEMIVREAGLEEKGITPHKLRHHFATELRKKKVPIETISKLLGHEDVSITAKYYAHIGDEEKRDAVDHLDYGEV
jgi:integrase